jgi:EAL domain-containing protein (putative c-di-GMP-specific phosphodiesterase class I)
MARALGLHVTAEGVETPTQLAELKRLRVPCAQGFLMSRPVPAATIARYVAEDHRWPVG